MIESSKTKMTYLIDKVWGHKDRRYEESIRRSHYKLLSKLCPSWDIVQSSASVRASPKGQSIPCLKITKDSIIYEHGTRLNPKSLVSKYSQDSLEQQIKTLLK